MCLEVISTGIVEVVSPSANKSSRFASEGSPVPKEKPRSSSPGILAFGHSALTASFQVLQARICSFKGWSYLGLPGTPHPQLTQPRNQLAVSAQPRRVIRFVGTTSAHRAIRLLPSNNDSSDEDSDCEGAGYRDSSDGEPDSDEITDSEDGEGYSCLDSGAFLHSVPDLRRLFLTTQDNSASLLSPAPDSSGTKQLILANRTFSLPSVPLCSSLEPEGETQVKGRWQAGQPPQRAAKQLLLSMLENFKSAGGRAGAGARAGAGDIAGAGAGTRDVAGASTGAGDIAGAGACTRDGAGASAGVGARAGAGAGTRDVSGASAGAIARDGAGPGGTSGGASLAATPGASANGCGNYAASVTPTPSPASQALPGPKASKTLHARGGDSAFPPTLVCNTATPAEPMSCKTQVTSPRRQVLLSAPGSYLSHSTSLSDSGSPRPGTGTHSSGSPRLVTGTYSSSSSSACSPRLLPLLVSAAASDCPPLLGATAASDCPPLQGVAATSGCPPLLVVAAEEPVWLPETVTCGLCCEQGARASNEDMAFALEIYEKPMEHGSGDSPMSQPFSRAACFGVFDGHGGVEAAEHMTQNLPGLISKRCSHIKAQGAEEVTSIMLTLEAQLQERFNTEWYSMDRDPGTTALVATIIDDTLLVANVGDSRLILVTEAMDAQGNRMAYVSQATKDHTCKKNKEEHRRVLEAGSHIDDEGYVGSVLEVSRSIGDFRTKSELGAGVIIPDPDVTSLKLTPESLFLVAFSDGISSRMDDCSVCNMVARYLNERRHLNDPEYAARELCNYAVASGSSDNCSAVVVVLRNQPPPAPARRRLFNH